MILIHGLGGTTNTWSAMMAGARAGTALSQAAAPASAPASASASAPATSRATAPAKDSAPERASSRIEGRIDGWGACRIVSLDLPGSGHSPVRGEALSIADHVEAIRRVAAATGLARAHVIGHSMGCIIAQHFAVAEPERVASLTLFGPLPALPDAARPVIEARGERARSEGTAGMQAIADALLATAVSARTRRERRAACAFVRESLLRQPPAGYAANCAALAGARPAPVETLSCPVLLVTGDEDRVAPPDAVRAMAARFGTHRAVRVVVLSGCGHWHPIEQPEECERLALDHVQRAERQQQEARRRRELMTDHRAVPARVGDVVSRRQPAPQWSDRR